MQSGIEFIINNTQIHLYGGLLAFLADTLAAHEIGGFKVGVGFVNVVCV